MARTRWLAAAVVLGMGCLPKPGTTGDQDAGSAAVDAGVGDASVQDAATPDAGGRDASIPDAAPPDAGTPDAAHADAAVPDSAVVTTDGGAFVVDVLQTLNHMANGESHSMELLRLTNAAGGFAYAQWIAPSGAGARPVVVLTMPYDGISWTGETVDQRWAADHPGAVLGQYPDVDGPGYDGTGTVVYALMDPEVFAESVNIHLINGMGVLAVFGRFYAGGSIGNDVEDVVAGLRYLTTQPRADTSHVGIMGTSWGGFEALYGAAHAPAGVTVAAVAAISPPSDMEKMAQHLRDGLPSLIHDGAALANAQAFFKAYLRRIVATTGALPGEAGADFSGFTHADLVARLHSPTLLAHDDWDTLVPTAQSLDLALLAPGVAEMVWYREPTPVDWDTMVLTHGPILDEAVYGSVLTFSLGFLDTRLAPTGQTLLVPYAPPRLHDFAVRARAQRVHGLDATFLAARMADLDDSRVTLLDMTPGANLASTAGGVFVASQATDVFGEGVFPPVRNVPSCNPWDEPAPDAGTHGGCPTQSPDETGLPAANVDGGMGVVVHQNVTYATRDGRVLQGDLHIPAAVAGQHTGVMVVVHGGGFVDCGHRRDAVDGFAHGIMAGQNVATFNVEYRLVQEGGAFPNNVMDIKCAVQWLKQNAASYGLDGTRVVLAGESAGAQLVALVGLTQGRADLDPHCAATSDSVDAVLAFSGPHDLPLLAVTGPAGIPEAVALNAGPCSPVEKTDMGRSCSRCTDASAVAHAAGVLPEFVLLHAPPAFDQTVPLTQSELLHQALLFGGARSQLLVPTPDEMMAYGCMPDIYALQAHGFTPCLYMPVATPLSATIQQFIGLR